MIETTHLRAVVRLYSAALRAVRASNAAPGAVRTGTRLARDFSSLAWYTPDAVTRAAALFAAARAIQGAVDAFTLDDDDLDADNGRAALEACQAAARAAIEAWARVDEGAARLDNEESAARRAAALRPEGSR